jgi:solute carrier family 23 (nucleobase transporter), member 1
MANATETTHDLIYGIDDVPPPVQSVALGLQHYLTMLGSTVAVPLFLSQPLGIDMGTPEGLEAVSFIMATMFLVSGLATLLQSTFGNRLPIIQGATFSYLAPTVAICGLAHLKSQGWEVKMAEIQGAIIVGGGVQMALGYLGLIGKLLKYIGPVTIAPTIALIGLALFPFGVAKVGGNWLLGGLTIVLMILFSQILRKKHRSFELFPVLLAMGTAWLVAAVLTAAGVYETKADIGFVDLTAMNASPVFRVPTPFQWGMPTFGAAAIVAMFAGVIAGIVESIGDYYACARMSGAPIPDQKTINKGIGMEGVGCVLAGAFGTGNGTTSYSENIGAIGLTRVGSRRVVQIGAAIMILLGFFPMFSALFGAIPSPIIGGMYCTLFGMIAAVGLSNLQFVDLNSSRNLFIIGMALYLGLSAPVYFGGANLPLLFGEDLKWLHDIVVSIGKTGMAVGAFVAVILDNVIPGSDEERGLNAWKARPEAATPDHPSA